MEYSFDATREYSYDASMGHSHPIAAEDSHDVAMEDSIDPMVRQALEELKSDFEELRPQFDSKFNKGMQKMDEDIESCGSKLTAVRENLKSLREESNEIDIHADVIQEVSENDSFDSNLNVEGTAMHEAPQVFDELSKSVTMHESKRVFDEMCGRVVMNEGPKVFDELAETKTDILIKSRHEGCFTKEFSSILLPNFQSIESNSQIIVAATLEYMGLKEFVRDISMDIDLCLMFFALKSDSVKWSKVYLEIPRPPPEPPPQGLQYYFSRYHVIERIQSWNGTLKFEGPMIRSGSLEIILKLLLLFYSFTLSILHSSWATILQEFDDDSSIKMNTKTWNENDNVLLVGMRNREDMLEGVILRPGQCSGVDVSSLSLGSRLQKGGSNVMIRMTEMEKLAKGQLITNKQATTGKSLRNFRILDLPKYDGKRKYAKSITHLFGIRQKDDESLRSFVDRFNDEALDVQGLTNEIKINLTINALKMGPFADALIRD
ncbi:hypothetical protein BUALT_Bualt10G0023400 [Buddleja alternifolia]|uniref:Uncharacterized protein n=1 Tax=Buddleja alternifolia TaxID=168488 RepID=A0AAV6X2Q1_9LAMI|nr:hypothetical protein BUALT_Bualt10G0023400 [Buddleja alternifolia]